MLLRLSKMLSRSNCILILVMSNLADPAPLKSRKRSSNENEQGFSASPRILEIQLPLKITSKEDLIAWSKYVMSLVTSKINFTSNSSKDTSSVGTQHEKQVSLVSNSALKSREMMKKGSFNDKRQSISYPARRLKGPHVQRPDDKVVAYPLPIGGMKKAVSKPPDPFGIPTAGVNVPIDQHLQFGQYANFNDNLYQQSHINTFDVLTQQQPAVAYLPLSVRTPDIATYQNTISENVSSFEEPAKLQTTSNSFNLRIKAFNDEFGQVLPIAVSNDLTKKNPPRIGESLLAFPFQAVITITRQLPQPNATSSPKTSQTQSNEYFAIRARDPPDEFPPFFERNYTVKNKAGQISVIFNDATTDTSKKKMKENERVVEEAEEDENEEEEQGNRKKNEKKKKEKSRKRQSSTFGELLRMLGILRRPPKNTTEVSVATPILSILKGTNPQKIQVAFEETPPPLPNRERRNETVMSEKQTASEEEEMSEEQMSSDEDEEEEGGSIQSLIELLPLAAPLLEDLSDPESDVNIAEILQSAIPLLEGLSDPNEEGGIDIPAVLVPLSQRLSEGPDGQGSDSGAILGPLIQVIAPLIGPIVGPLIGPLSRTSSGPGGKEGIASLFTAIAGPLSEPRGPYGQSVLSSLIAGVTAGLSKEFAASAGDSDVKSLVSTLTAGVLAGASSGSSGNKANKPYGPQNDTYYAPTTYSGYNTYYKPQASSTNIKEMLKASVKQMLGAFLKLSATSSTSSANLSASSSSSSTSLSTTSSDGSQEPPHNPPVYSVPAYPAYSPPSQRPTYQTSTSSPYATLFARRQVKPIKKV